jgi:hypothetical protein
MLSKRTAIDCPTGAAEPVTLSTGLWSPDDRKSVENVTDRGLVRETVPWNDLPDQDGDEPDARPTHLHFQSIHPATTRTTARTEPNPNPCSWS